ncbi:MAG: SpoIIE family protein phosphatase [Flavobacteriales bacterium]|nr:SpoIIE family protein phosphatase [Flavobacteriales bacterium]
MSFSIRPAKFRVLTALLCGLMSMPAQAQIYDFQNFTTENGLSQSQVLALFQGDEGELWMGTNSGGVNRYNGTGFTYLTKENGLTDNTVFAFARDANGRLLIGTNNGITVMDGLRIDTVTQTQGLTHAGIHSILVAKDGTIWVGTRKGVCILQGLDAEHFAADDALSAATVLSIREGSDGSIWFCTVQSGVFRWNGSKMDRYGVESGLERNYVFDVMPLGRYDAWIFGYDGLYHLKGGKATIQNLAEVPKGTTYYTFQRDRAGNIWIGTSQGVLKYDGKGYTLLTKASGLVDNNIWKVLQDREGNLWFASKSLGVSKLNSERFKLYNSADLPDLKVNGLLRDSKGRLWLGTGRGLVIWGQAGEHKVFTLKDGLSTEVIRAMKEDAQGNIYIATGFGLTVYDGTTFKGAYSTDEGLNSIYDIVIDGNEVWLCTKEGVAKYENGQITRPANAFMYKNFVFHGCKRRDGLWFAYEDGLLHYDGKKFENLKAKQGFTDGRTRSVITGPDGHLWFGTNDGIYRWNGKGLLNISQNDGLMSNAVYSLAFDREGNLWAGQSKGVCKVVFDGETVESVIKYGRDQGFLGLDCNANSILIAPDDVIWLGTANGLVTYDPSLDKGEYYQPLMRITEIKLFSQSVNWSLFTDSITISGLPSGLALPYDKNHLTFEFSGVSLTSPSSINYSYLLEGFDEDWSPITNNSDAAYANLPPGTYVFKVRAGYGSEIWKNAPVEFRFKVKPPFYRTWWFYLVCGLIVVGIAYSYYTIRRANVQITRQKGEIETQKDVIEKKKDEIEKKNREMLDSINYASTIQSAILPSDDLWFKLLPNSFVLFMPKDIVSGDFYWLENRGSEVFFAAVDCTGHGVPGALMSIIGANGLNQAVNEHRLLQPATILNYLSMSVNESLRKSERSNYVKDGMDLALCRLNLKTRILKYAGAYNPLIIIRNGELMVTKADRLAIGSMDNTGKSFQEHEIQLQEGDCIYVFSDGYADQFGGPDGKKLKSRPMQDKLLEVSVLPMNLQHQRLQDFFMKWKGDLEQVDDICIIGVRV